MNEPTGRTARTNGPTRVALAALSLTAIACASILPGCAMATAPSEGTSPPTTATPENTVQAIEAPHPQGGPRTQEQITADIAVRLQALVNEGTITQEQSDAHMEWWQSRPEVEADFYLDWAESSPGSRLEDWLAAMPDIGDADLGPTAIP